MVVYYVLMALPILYFLYVKCSGDLYQQNVANKRAIVLFFAGLIVLLWLRDKTVGNDCENYLDAFFRIKKMSFEKIWASGDEWGYRVLNKIIAMINDGQQFFFLAIALFSLVPIMILYKKESEDAIVTIGLFSFFVFSMYFSGFRQICAMSFVVPAYYATKHRKFLLFLVSVGIAYLFHQSAVAILLLYPIYRLKITKPRILYLIPFWGLIFLRKEAVFSVMLRILPSQYEETYSEISPTGAYSVLLLLILFVIVVYLIMDDTLVDADTMGMRNVLLLTAILQIFASVSTVAMRLNYYYLLLLPIALTKCISKCHFKYRQIADWSFAGVGIFFIGYFFYNAYVGRDILNVFPYKFYFS